MRERQVLAQGIQALDGAAHRHRYAIERKGAGIAEHPGVAIDTARDEHRTGTRALQVLRRVLGREHIARTNHGNLDGVVRIGDGTAPHILSISLVGYPSANVVTELGAQGICISAGSACRGQLSHVYRAMGLDKKTAAGVLRVSFGPETTKEEIDALVSALKAHRDTRFPML